MFSLGNSISWTKNRFPVVNRFSVNDLDVRSRNRIYGVDQTVTLRFSGFPETPVMIGTVDHGNWRLAEIWGFLIQENGDRK